MYPKQGADSAIEAQSIMAKNINQNMVSIDNLARQGDG